MLLWRRFRGSIMWSSGADFSLWISVFGFFTYDFFELVGGWVVLSGTWVLR
jgi:hypothetical protein